MTDQGGYPQYGYQYQPPPQAQTNGKAVTALVLGIVSLVVCSIVGIVAIVIGNQARREIAQTGQQGDGMARAGIILGWVAVVLTVLGIVLAGIIVAIGLANS